MAFLPVIIFGDDRIKLLEVYMIDPKLNEIPVNRTSILEEDENDSSLTAERRRQPRQGLSINDTIARDANLSVGSRGTDTSGVEAGTGAGAGLSLTTPSNNGSPAPEIVPGARGSGTTPHGSVGVDELPTVHVSSASDLIDNEEDERPASHHIAARAYECWHARGCPDGSPEVDWHRAEEELRLRRARSAGA